MSNSDELIELILASRKLKINEIEALITFAKNMRGKGSPEWSSFIRRVAVHGFKSTADATLSPISAALAVTLFKGANKILKYAERHSRSLAIPTPLDFTKVKLSLDWLPKKGTKTIDGETRYQYLLADKKYIPLNTEHYLWCWNNPDKLPEEWKDGRYITFDGDALFHPHNISPLFVDFHWSSRRFQGGLRARNNMFNHGFPSAMIEV